MDLGYLRRLHLRTAGRVSLGERGRPAGRDDGEREALERLANTLDDLAREPSLSSELRRVLAATCMKLMRVGY